MQIWFLLVAQKIDYWVMIMLTDADLIVGHTYWGKCRRKTRHALYNDRKIIWRDENNVQYDGPAVSIGAGYPIVSVQKFISWARCDENMVNK